jgi:Protein kinase domain
MLRFEDLLAARMLARQLPDRVEVLQSALETLQEGEAKRSLLSSLVAINLVTMDQARYVHTQVETHKRQRALGIYAHLLTSSGGMPRDRVKRFVDQLGSQADMNGLGDSVVGAGQLPPAREQQLRFQARLAADRDMAKQVEAYLVSQQAQQPQSFADQAPSPDVALTGSGRIQLSQVIRPDEAVKIVQGTLSDADGELPGPQFRIPDTVDMSDPRTGKQMMSYRILGRVGEGAMGTVYLVDTQEDPTKPMALKMIPKDASADAKGRFKREILANGFFSHPNALEIFDAGETDGGQPFLAMEFVDGADLSDAMAERPLPFRAAIDLTLQAFSALGAAHQAGVVHRDVKPANILVSRDMQHAKLMDFGIAIIRDLGEFEEKVFRSMEGGVTGTPEYMSPEQASGDPITEASDIYSMGVVLYHLLANRLPFDSETSTGFITCHMIEDPIPLVKANPATKVLPRELHDLLGRLLEKNPKNRPASCQEVEKVLREVLPKVKDRGTGGFWSWFSRG